MKDCQHERHELRKRTIAGGAVKFVEQCLDCGCQIRDIPKKDLWKHNLPAIAEWDEALRTSYQSVRMAEWQQESQAVRDAETAEWRAWYNAYLQTPEWQAIRVKVLRRDRGICQGCGEAGATQVHHLTYDRVGREMLFDLVSVCRPCHLAIHKKEGAR